MQIDGQTNHRLSHRLSPSHLVIHALNETRCGAGHGSQGSPEETWDPIIGPAKRD